MDTTGKFQRIKFSPAKISVEAVCQCSERKSMILVYIDFHSITFTSFNDPYVQG